MSEAKNVNEANVNNTTTAEVEGTKLEATKVENGKVVYEEQKPKKAGLGTMIKKGIIKLGLAIKRHPIAAALIVTGTGAAGYGIKKAYDAGTKDGFAEGYSAKTAEVEAEEQRKAEEQSKLEETTDVPEIEAMENEELGEEVG